VGLKISIKNAVLYLSRNSRQGALQKWQYNPAGKEVQATWGAIHQ